MIDKWTFVNVLKLFVKFRMAMMILGLIGAFTSYPNGWGMFLVMMAVYMFIAELGMAFVLRLKISWSLWVR